MISLASLWLPILVAAVIVFVASAIVHMVLPHHRTDYRSVPSEDAVMSALRPFAIPPGDYMMPRANSPKEMKDPAFVEKWNRGPVAVLTVFPSGSWGMGAKFGQWFVYCVVVSLFGAYVASRTLGPGSDYLMVFRITGTVAFAGYALALWQFSIWYGRAWTTTLKSTVDSLVYALLTGGVFGWLWPR
jgi:hypothetical protein